MGIINGAVTASTTPTAFTFSGLGSDTVRVRFRNHGPEVTYFGNASVTASTGYPLAVADSYEWPIRLYSGELYYVVETGTSDLRYTGVA